MSVRDYITGKLRFPPGPASGTGEVDVLMVEDIDLQFGDDEELKFGDLPDGVMAWDGTDLTLDIAVGSFVLTSTHGAITGEEHSLDIISTATLSSSSDSLVGLNVAVTPSGTLGGWAAAIFGKVTEVAAAPGPIGGYFCAAEFEVNITGTQPTAYGVLVLNSNADNETYGSFEGYIWLREYGSKAVRSLFNFMDHSRATESNTAIVSVTGSKPFDTMIRCTIGAAGTTGLWLLASSGGPADANIDFKMLGSAAGHYVEWDASADVLNVVIADKVIVGKEIGIDVNMAVVVGAGDYVIGCRSQVTPTGAAAGGGAVYSMAFQGIHTMAGANRSATGYATVAELRMIMSGTFDPPTWAVLMLLADDDNTSGNLAIDRSFIRIMDSGTREMTNLFVFADFTRGSANDAIMVSQMPQTPFDTAIRCLFGTTAMWLYGSTVGPASIADFKWIGSGATKYLEIDASNDRVNMALMGFKWTSASFSGTGLDFNSAVFAAGGDYNVLSYGDYANPVTISITDHCIPLRMNIISDNNPGTAKMFAFMKFQFAQTTEAQDNLFVHAIDLGLTLTKGLEWVHGVNLFMDIADTLTVDQGVHVLKATLDLTSAKTLTYHDAAVILAEVTGAGSNSCSGPVASELCCLMLKVAAVSTIGSMITFFQINGCAVTNGIYVGSGAITNLFNFERGGGETAVTVGAQCQTSSGSGVVSDGAIRILVLGTPYYIPFYTASNTANSW